VLVSKGYFESTADAFDKILKESTAFTSRPKGLAQSAQSDLLRISAAFAVLAHPFLNLDCTG
jgi:hypothetical protein